MLSANQFCSCCSEDHAHCFKRQGELPANIYSFDGGGGEYTERQYICKHSNEFMVVGE